MSSSSSSSPTNSLTLITSDGARFPVSESAAMNLGTIRNMMIVGCTKNEREIELPNTISGESLRVILKWCNEKHSDDATEEEVKKWNAEFVKDMNERILYHLLIALDFLDSPELMDLLTQKVANMIRGRKIEEIRQTFNIKNDFTPEQEAEHRRKTQWAFDMFDIPN